MSTSYSIGETIEQIKDYINKNRLELFKQFMVAFVLIGWCYIGLLLVNYFFSDDLARFPNANRGWLQDGRYIMHGFYQFLTMNFSKSIVSASAYTYFLTTAILALNSLLLANYFNKKNIYISIVISCLVVITPFYWYWMLYVHERLPMAISLFIAIAIVLFSYNVKPWQAFISQTLAMLSLFYMYQVAIIAFMVMVAFMFAYHLMQAGVAFKLALRKVVKSIISLTLATILFEVFDGAVISSLGFGQRMTYSSGALNFSDRLAEFPMRWQEIVSSSKNAILEWSHTTFAYLCLVIVILFAILMLYNLFKTKPNLITAIAFIITLGLMIFGISVLFFLNNLIHRFYTPFTIAIALAMLYFYNNNDNKILNRIAIGLTIAITMNCLSMASYLADYLQKQYDHQLKMGALLEDDIYQAKKAHANIETATFVYSKNIIQKIELEGSPVYLPMVYNYLRRIGLWAMPIRISSLATYWDWADSNFTLWGDSRAIAKFKKTDKEAPIELVDRRYYKINYYPDFGHLEIIFKEATTNKIL